MIPEELYEEKPPLGLAEHEVDAGSASQDSKELFISADLNRKPAVQEPSPRRVDRDAPTLALAAASKKGYAEEPYAVLPFSDDINHAKPTERDFAVFRFIWVQFLQQFRDEFLAGVEQSGHHTRGSLNPEKARLQYYDRLRRKTFRHIDHFVQNIPEGKIRDAATGFRRIIAEIFQVFESQKRSGRAEAKEMLDELIAAVKPEKIFDLTSLQEVGRGAFGVVYSVILRATGERVALKLVKPKNHAAFCRLQQEVFRLLETTDEERVVSAYGAFYTPADIAGIPGSKGHVVIVSEYFEGQSLTEFIEQLRDLSAQERLSKATEITAQVAEALVGLHRLGIRHRDLKPDNIIVCPDGSVRLLDLGLSEVGIREVNTELPTVAVKRPALPQAEELSSSTTDPRSTCDTKLDTHGAIGTPAYMSPENLAGAAFKETSDAWALWVIFWEMATGTKLYDGFNRTSLETFLKAIQSGETTMKNLLMQMSHQEHMLNLPHILRNALIKGFSSSPADRLLPLEMSGLMRAWRILHQEEVASRRLLLAEYCRARVAVGAIDAPDHFESALRHSKLPSLLGSIESHLFARRDEMLKTGGLADYLQCSRVLDEVIEASFLELRQAS